jgi:Baseplate J-like protein
MTTPLINPALTPVTPVYYPVLQPPTAIDYTSKDWTGFTTSMLNYASVIMPEWDTSSEGDLGVMLVELLAYICDVLSFYGDRLTQEAYLPTATQRLSVLNLAQLLGYVPVNGAAASGTVTFQTDSGGPAIAVPAGTQVSTSFDSDADQPIIYETTEPVTVGANGGTSTVTVSQGITSAQVNIGTSNGTAGQSFQIPVPNVVPGSVIVYVQTQNNGLAQWNAIQFLVDASPDELVYSLTTDQNQITSVNFGDNINGAIPGNNLSIYATYTIGVGSAGNQPAGQVGTIISSLTGITIPAQSSTSTLFQSSAMTGGADPETNDQIRANAPQAYATQQRAVSITDFASLSLNIPGVLMASAVANHSTSVTLFLLGPNYLTPSATLQQNVLNYFEGANDGIIKTLAGVTLTIGSPDLVLTDVGTSVNNMQLQVLPNYNQGVVVQNVTTALQAALSPPNTTFGMLLNISYLYAAVMAVAGVAYAIIPVMTREDLTQAGVTPIQYRPSEIPVYGSIFITAQGGIVT